MHSNGSVWSRKLSDAEGHIVIQRVGDIILVPLQGLISERLLTELRDGILDHLQRHHVRGAVFDMTSVEVLDVHDFDGLRRVAEAAMLMGVSVILSGVRPGVAAGLTMLDADASWVRAVRSVEGAIKALQ